MAGKVKEIAEIVWANIAKYLPLLKQWKVLGSLAGWRDQVRTRKRFLNLKA
tara:strand:+ start:5351 stop:5503 length:153 start_codon:yes stop_codon:yes gene_type:complete